MASLDHPPAVRRVRAPRSRLSSALQDGVARSVPRAVRAGRFVHAHSHRRPDRAVRLAAESPRAEGETMFVGHPSPQSGADVLRAIAAALARPFRPLHIPGALLPRPRGGRPVVEGRSETARRLRQARRTARQGVRLLGGPGAAGARFRGYERFRKASRKRRDGTGTETGSRGTRNSELRSQNFKF